MGNTQTKGLELSLQTDVQHQLAFDLAYTLLDSYYVKYDDFYLALGNARGTKVNSLAELTDPNNQVYFQHFDNGGKQVPRTPTHAEFPHTLASKSIVAFYNRSGLSFRFFCG